MAKLTFPKGFLWGASTAAHQVEGGNYNQWSIWEQENAERLAEQAREAKGHMNKFWGVEPPVWDSIQEEACKPVNYISGRACDHFHLYEKDFDIMKDLNLNGYRFSIEWSRIEPEEGKFSQKALEHYKKMIRAMKKRGITPFLTLWHWTVPAWFEEKGGWTNFKSNKYFKRYVEEVVKVLSEEVDFWITLNEPDIYNAMSYLFGEWPPQKRRVPSYLLVRFGLINAHKEAYKVIKKYRKNAKVGFSTHNAYMVPYQNHWYNRVFVFLVKWWINHFNLDSLKNFSDFIGVNYYSRSTQHINKIINPNEILSDLGWELFPHGIYYVLKDLKKYKVPVYITEHGLADMMDEKREWYIKESLKSIHQAIEEGVDVRGYFHWSLMDNFEWDKGFWPKFGLLEVDFTTMERKVRKSAKEYAKIAKSNGLEV